MKAEAGTTIRWRGEDVEVLVVRPLAALLRDANGEEFEVSVEELQRQAEPSQSTLRSEALQALFEAGEITTEVRLWKDAVDRIIVASQTYGEKEKAVAHEAEFLSGALSRSVSIRTVYRQLQAYEDQGLAGLTDQRVSALQQRRRRIDPRVVETINKVLAGRSRASTVSKTALIEQIRALALADFGDDIRIPSNATMHRLLQEADRGRFSFGSAKTRETLSLAPSTAFGQRAALRPGEQVQIDTTPLDVMVRIDETTIGRPDLTILLDVATRSILAAVLRPVGTKSMDLVVVLARALVPYARRPEGARETRRLISTAWAEDVLIDQQRYERFRESQPFIFPETITTDRGRNYLSKHFEAACERLGISLITAAPHTPTDKPHIERTFKSIASLFLEYCQGYVGRSVEYRGKDADTRSEQLLTIAQMQELLEDWIAVEWQNRSHDGMRDPLHPSIQLSPNEMCRAFRHVAPELHVPLTRDDFIALLPVVRRRINRYGVTVDHRIYDSKRLAEYRRRQSPVKSKQGRWRIRLDPYNLHVVWLDADGEFIPLHWTNNAHDLPMLGDVWRYARDEYWNEAGQDSDEQEQLARAMRAFASTGNPKQLARRVARAKSVAADPMNFTSAIATISVADDAVETTDEESPEEWPNRGGFELIGEPMQEIRWRADQ